VAGHFRYVAEFQSRGLALVGRSTPARPSRARHAWIGWSNKQRNGARIQRRPIVRDVTFAALGLAIPTRHWS